MPSGGHSQPERLSIKHKPADWSHSTGGERASSTGARSLHDFRSDFPNRPRIFIQTGTGTIAGLFEFIVPFIHNGGNSRDRQQ